jgi:hypothetical protein
MDIFLAQIGLILDFVGVCFLFEYDLPSTINNEGESSRGFWKNVGFVLISLGFLLQLISTGMPENGKLFHINTHFQGTGYAN